LTLAVYISSASYAVAVLDHLIIQTHTVTNPSLQRRQRDWAFGEALAHP